MSFDDVTVVIPTLNEEEGIGRTIDELLRLGVDRRRILVVDGFSSDRTVEVARSRGVRVVFQEGRGKAAAVRTAIRYVDTRYILVMDGDYTYDPSRLPEMLALMDRCVEVIGARVEGRENIPWINRFGNRVLTWLFNLIFGTDLSDVLSGMYLIRADLARELLGKSSGFSIEAEIAAHMSLEGEIGEVPIRYRRRLGRPKLSVFDGVRIGLSMIRLGWTYNPLFFIFMLGVLALFPGVALGLYVLLDYIFNFVVHRTLSIIALLLIAIGVISSFFAILILFLKRMEFRIIRKIEALRSSER